MKCTARVALAGNAHSAKTSEGQETAKPKNARQRKIMKQKNNLIEEIADMENIRLAFWKARRSKEGKNEVQEFIKDFDVHLININKQILSGEVDVGNYHYFKIFDPKERLICAASFQERVLHHAIMNVCHSLFERQLIYHSYATRPEKGTYKALDEAKRCAKKYKWCAKLDVRKYFDNISHGILKDMLSKIMKDKKLLDILSKIIDSYHTSEGKGIPIGNLTSLYLANFYLSPSDHYALENLNVMAYIRYMDDILIFDDDKSKLNVKVKQFVDYVENTYQLVFKPVIIVKSDDGIVFLGYKIFKYYVRLNSASKKRFLHKINIYNKLLNADVWSQLDYSRHVVPLISFTEYAADFRIIAKC